MTRKMQVSEFCKWLCNELLLWVSRWSENTNTVTASVLKTLKVGDWCVVLHDDQQYPGEVINIINEDVEVSVMHRSWVTCAQSWKVFQVTECTWQDLLQWKIYCTETWRTPSFCSQHGPDNCSKVFRLWISTWLPYCYQI